MNWFQKLWVRLSNKQYQKNREKTKIYRSYDEMWMHADYLRRQKWHLRTWGELSNGDVLAFYFKLGV
jgi:hypothetical protein